MNKTIEQRIKDTQKKAERIEEEWIRMTAFRHLDDLPIAPSLFYFVDDKARITYKVKTREDIEEIMKVLVPMNGLIKNGKPGGISRLFVPMSECKYLDPDYINIHPWTIDVSEHGISVNWYAIDPSWPEKLIDIRADILGPTPWLRLEFERRMELGGSIVGGSIVKNTRLINELPNSRHVEWGGSPPDSPNRFTVYWLTDESPIDFRKDMGL
jgi:hypothetical protein